MRRQPPRLLVKTLTVTFVMAALLLLFVFGVVTFTVRGQVRRAVAANLEASQRIFGAVESREQHEMLAQATNLAENPTLKAAIDTYAAESRTTTAARSRALLTTIEIELAKVAERVDADAVVIVDAHQIALASAGPLANRWPVGQHVTLVGDARNTFDGVVRTATGTFRVIAVPLVLDDGTTIASLDIATSLDRRYAEQLAALSRTRTAIVSDGLLVASTLPAAAEREFESTVARTGADEGTLDVGGETLAFRRLVQIDDTGFYAIASIDESSAAAMSDAFRALVSIALGAMSLALLGSVWLAHLLTKPIGRLSSSLQAMAAARRLNLRLPLDGSSRELDALTETFNALMSSVIEAEAQTEAAYTGAIRALATALDARDPYTAGHSERVSVVSVAIGRALNLSDDDIEVIRLGALLHDIGKIGVPDEVLRKPGPLTPAEFEAIRLHPVLGARILRSVPFLARHIAIVELHHERPDGRGYPKGLRGDDIPLAARIVHVADAYDAITSARAYRGARPAADALRELWRCAGTEFHAEIVGALAMALPGVTTTERELEIETING
ncbi:MAG TPA: HD domain-containing phosphohydrolase [Vicinamibacterales bacterium]